MARRVTKPKRDTYVMYLEKLLRQSAAALRAGAAEIKKLKGSPAVLYPVVELGPETLETLERIAETMNKRYQSDY